MIGVPPAGWAGMVPTKNLLKLLLADPPSETADKMLQFGLLRAQHSVDDVVRWTMGWWYGLTSLRACSNARRLAHVWASIFPQDPHDRRLLITDAARSNGLNVRDVASITLVLNDKTG